MPRDAKRHGRVAASMSKPSCAIKPSLLCQQEAPSSADTKVVATLCKHARRPSFVTDFIGSVTTHSSGSSCTTSKSWGDTCAPRSAGAGAGLRGTGTGTGTGTGCGVRVACATKGDVALL